MENHNIRPEVIDALSSGVGKSMRLSVTLEEEMLYVAIPIDQDSKVLGVVRMSIPSEADKQPFVRAPIENYYCDRHHNTSLNRHRLSFIKRPVKTC